MKERACKQCGKIFETENSRKIFCGANCAMLWHASKNNRRRSESRNLNGVCPYCGKDFVKVRISQIYCSEKCKDSAQGERKTRGKEHEVKCAFCGSLFKTRRHNQKLCLDCRDQRSKGSWRVAPLTRKDLWDRQDHKCWLCGGDLKYEDTVAHHLDGRGHVKNPDNSPENLVALHKTCHYMFHRPNLVMRNGEWGIDGKIFGYLKVKNLKVFFEERS